MLQVSCVNVYNYPEVLQKIRWITEMNKKYEEMGRYEVKTAKYNVPPGMTLKIKKAR